MYWSKPARVMNVPAQDARNVCTAESMRAAASALIAVMDTLTKNDSIHVTKAVKVAIFAASVNVIGLPAANGLIFFIILNPQVLLLLSANKA